MPFFFNLGNFTLQIDIEVTKYLSKIYLNIQSKENHVKRKKMLNVGVILHCYCFLNVSAFIQ